MNTLLGPSLLAGLLVASGCVKGERAQRDAESSSSLTVAELRQRPVIGELSVPLGTIVDLTAEVVSGNSLRWKYAEGRYLLRVIKVERHVLDHPVIMDFEHWSPDPCDLACDDAEFQDVVRRKLKEGATQADVNAFASHYVGRKYRLVGFESGGFSGVPDVKPGMIPYSGYAYGFHNKLVVMEVKH